MNNVLASFALAEPRIFVRRPHLVLVHSGVFYFIRDRVDADLVLWRGEVSAEVITGMGGGTGVFGGTGCASAKVRRMSKTAREWKCIVRCV